MTKNKFTKIILIILTILILFVAVTLKIFKNDNEITSSNNKNINTNEMIKTNSDNTNNNKSNITEEENTNKQSSAKVSTEIQDNIDKDGNQKEQTQETSNADAENKGTEKLTSKQAEEIINKYVGGNNSQIECRFDHTDKKNGIDYYVIHAYENMEDHTATIGWYYVNVNTGEAYEWDLISDKLKPLK